MATVGTIEPMQSTATPGQWSHADTDRLAKFFGFASRMHDLLEALHREAQLHGKGDVEVATLLKEIDAACFND